MLLQGPPLGWPLPTPVSKMATLGEAKGGHLAKVTLLPKILANSDQIRKKIRKDQLLQ